MSSATESFKCPCGGTIEVEYIGHGEARYDEECPVCGAEVDQTELDDALRTATTRFEERSARRYY